MTLTYKRHFPSDVSEEKLLECVTEIVTDPKNRWEQITGQGHLLCRSLKYLADGEFEGKKIRVIFEPCGRGILVAYPIDQKNSFV